MNLKNKKARIAIDLSFRRHHARVTAQLLARFGSDHLDIIEEALLATFAKAMEAWPYQGVPDNPGAWLTTTAGHEVIDTLRKSKRWSDKISNLLAIELDAFDEIQYHADMQPELRLMFLCCLAEIDPKDQMILILKFLCGFDNEKIAFVFMSSVSGIDKRISRCRKRMKIRELPELKPNVIESSSPVVKRTLYLLFNEGYHSGVSEDVVKTDICDEAIRLTELLLKVLEKDVSVYALLALMYLHRSRLQSKIDELGHLVLLQDQDRSLWDRNLINKGLELWQISLKGWTVSQYHIEAGIAAHHCMAESMRTTNWQSIVELYELLLKLNPSSTVVLNRLIAKSQIKVDKQLLDDALLLKKDANLQNYPYLYSFLGDLYLQMDDQQFAKNNYQRALQLCRHTSDRKVVESKIAALG